MANNRLIFFALCLSVVSQSALASFSETSRRYLAPRDMFNLMEQKFPVFGNVERMRDLKATCWAAGPYNINLTGAVNPAVGAPASETPVTGFVRWRGTCTFKIIELQFSVLKAQTDDTALWERYFPKALAAKRAELDTIKWSALSDQQREEAIRLAVETMIGPEAVIKDLGFVPDMASFIAMVKKAIGTDASVSVFQQMQKILLVISLREEFITY